MKSKKKFIISLSIAVSVLLIAIVSIISISAALNQNISSNIKVNFKPSQHVIGYVSAKYTYGNVTHDMTTNGMGNGNTSVSFNYNDKETTKTLMMKKDDLKDGQLNVGEDISNIILEFEFTNTGYSDFTACLNLNAITKMENIRLLYSRDGGMWTPELFDTEVASPLNLQGDYVKKFYIMIKVDNNALDAKFEGDIMWNLIAEEG